MPDTPYRSQCKCDCHKPGSMVMHFQPCCQPDLEPLIPDIEQVSRRWVEIHLLSNLLYQKMQTEYGEHVFRRAKDA